jgi:hypothetical protein
MHFLFATSIVPDGALGSGYEIANAAIIDALRRSGARVTVLGFSWPGKAPSDPQNTIVLGELDVRTDSASAGTKLAWLAKAMRSGLTFSSVKLRAVPAEEIRRTIDKAGPFDGVILNSVQFAGAFENLFDQMPSIFVAHNVEHRSAQENAAAATSPLQRFLYKREARLLKKLEERLCDKARFVFTLAQEDRSALGVGSDDRSAVLPLVTRPQAPRLAPGRRIDCDAALIGTWTWQPNRIGLDWFLENVVPHLPRDFRVRIAGSAPSGLSSSHPGVEFVGRVPDAEAFIRSAAVVPLISRAGTGVQLKTIETFELGLPSVATTSALRGIDHLPQNCVVCDDPADFAKALVETAALRSDAIDGSAFYRCQLSALDAAIARGLQKLGRMSRGIAA